jgi:hypothetical protein
MAVGSAIVPLTVPPELWRVSQPLPPALHPMIVYEPLSGYEVLAVIMPRSRAAVAVISLNVEPGAYWPWMARLMSGLLASPPLVSSSNRSCEMPFTNSAGL